MPCAGMGEDRGWAPSGAGRSGAIEWPPRDPLPAPCPGDPADHARAGHDRRHRARHRFRARLPRLAALPWADPAAPRRRQGVDRVDPPRRRGDRRLRDPRHGRAGPARPPRPPVDPVAHARCRAARRVPGMAGPRDRPPRQLRGVRHRPPGRRDDPGRTARLRHDPFRLPGSHRRARGQPAVHDPGRVRGGRDLRAPALRLQRDRDGDRADLPGLAAHGRVGGAPADRADVRSRAASMGRGRRRRDRGDRGDRRVANPARPPDGRPARAHRGRALRRAGAHRRRAGPRPGWPRGPRRCISRSARSSGR